MTEQEQIDSLKTQVNCLREVLEQLAKLGNGDKYGNSIGNTIAINALAKTPEQCLAEVKAKAIEDACKEEGYTDCDGNKICPTENLLEYANNILEQAK